MTQSIQASTSGREIILDTETTGLDPKHGHRVVEIGCIEVVEGIPTGEHFHAYLNPERDMPQPAFAVHGLSREFLEKHPLFLEVVDSFLDFVRNDPLVIHNAAFDMKFLQAELARSQRELLTNPIVDTLLLARRKFPGAPASLDMLCKRFQIDNSNREKHGALLDAELLAQVYIELQEGGRQPKLKLMKEEGQSTQESQTKLTERPKRTPRVFAPSKEETLAYKTLMKNLV